MTTCGRNLFFCISYVFGMHGQCFLTDNCIAFSVVYIYKLRVKNEA